MWTWFKPLVTSLRTFLIQRYLKLSFSSDIYCFNVFLQYSMARWSLFYSIHTLKYLTILGLSEDAESLASVLFNYKKKIPCFFQNFIFWFFSVYSIFWNFNCVYLIIHSIYTLIYSSETTLSYCFYHFIIFGKLTVILIFNVSAFHRRFWIV